jgi:hypothetical protein
MAHLTNTASGVCGEAAVVACLLRAGIRVARPYWLDEIDYLVFVGNEENLYSIPVQVKTVQAPPKGHAIRIQGLRKAHVDHYKYLCLVVYLVNPERFWIIPTAANIREAYDHNPVKGRKYKSLKRTDQVKISFKVPPAVDGAFDKKWLHSRHAFNRLNQVFNNVSNEMQNDVGLQNTATFKYVGGVGSNVRVSGEATAT